VRRVAEGSIAARCRLLPGTLRSTIEGSNIILGGDIILQVNEVTVEDEESYDRYCQVNGRKDEIRLLMRHTALMSTSASLDHRHRFPTEIISHCVWLYFRFALSFRDVEEMLAMRGVSLSYETVRELCLKFSQTYAKGLRHRLFPYGEPRFHHCSVSASSVKTGVFQKVSGCSTLFDCVWNQHVLTGFPARQ
jgi:hypothetical protein